MQVLSSQALSSQSLGMQALSSEALSSQALGMQATEAPYQPYFLPQDRAGKPQNMPEDIRPIKLFQLFFTVKEIENMVKQTNQRAVCIDFRKPWKPLTVREA